MFCLKHFQHYKYKYLYPLKRLFLVDILYIQLWKLLLCLEKPDYMCEISEHDLKILPDPRSPFMAVNYQFGTCHMQHPEYEYITLLIDKQYHSAEPLKYNIQVYTNVNPGIMPKNSYVHLFKNGIIYMAAIIGKLAKTFTVMWNINMIYL